MNEKKHIIIGLITNRLLQKAKLKLLVELSKKNEDFISKITDEYAINQALKKYLGAKK